jgi:hypothetical protein
MKTLLVIVVVQSLNLVVFWWFNQLAWFRILALRQQLAVYKRKEKKPRLRNRDRLFWSLLSKVWRDWASELIIVKPETVIRWRKRKFREFWRRKSQGRLGRPAIPKEHRVHQGLNAIPDPDPALDEPKPVGGRLVAIPVLNGLHHDYRLAA